MREAASKAGIGFSSAYRLETDPLSNSSGRGPLERYRQTNIPGIKDNDHLRADAKRALADFAFFRLRYFGRKSKKWQVAAANQILALMETNKREFAVINAPPGSGKSTLFTHDIPCWLIARKRSIRIMVISASESRARQYTEQILTTLERTSPPPLEEEQEQRQAVRAQACMQADFGRFKPENARRWRAGSFKVAQAHNMAGTGKESTVVGVGADTRYLGDRVDLLIADDLVTEETTGTPEAREKVLRKWRNEAEKRIEKRGVCILQGQRMKAEDLYRTCIDLKAWADPNDPYSDPDARKYLHVIFKAHYEDRCDGQHLESDPEYDPFNPELGGCLLDPVGLPWPYLMQERADDERTYRTVFQQEDMDPDSVLVNPLWVDGGEDPVTGELFPGCWDPWRPTGVIPPVPGVSYLTVDSSPSQWWSNQWWYYSRETERRFLIDHHRARMKVTDALEYNKDTKKWSALFEDWWQVSVEQGAPIAVLVFEAVAAEKYFLQSRDLIDWAAFRNVRVIKHETHRNKTDPKMGLQVLGPLYRHGKVRLPGDKVSGAYKKSMHLVTEATRYPESNTEDCLMAQWFGEFQLDNIAPIHVGTMKRANKLHLMSVPRAS
ncbi:MAG: hypothetical protein WB777_14195 [Mycobacterium sp.]